MFADQRQRRASVARASGGVGRLASVVPRSQRHPAAATWRWAYPGSGRRRRARWPDDAGAIWHHQRASSRQESAHFCLRDRAIATDPLPYPSGARPGWQPSWLGRRRRRAAFDDVRLFGHVLYVVGAVQFVAAWAIELDVRGWQSLRAHSGFARRSSWVLIATGLLTIAGGAIASSR